MPSRGVSLSASAETSRQRSRVERLKPGRIISALALAAALILCWCVAEVRPTASVSYTHLTLPTICSV